MTLQDLERIFKETTPKNIGGFIKDIRLCDRTQSIPTLTLLGFLNKIIDDFMPNAQALCDESIQMDEESAAEMLMYAKILAANILLLHKANSRKVMSEKMLLLLQWNTCFGTSDSEAASVAVKCLSCKCTDPGFSWDTIKDAMSTGIIIYHIFTRGKFDGGPLLPSFSFEGKGAISFEEGALHISSGGYWRTGAKAWEICNGSIMVHTRNSRDEKLKASYLNNAAQLMEFAKTYGMSQASMGNSATSLEKEVKAGGQLTVKCDEIREEDGITVMDAIPLYTTIDRKGTLRNEELIKGMWTEDLIPYIFEGDCIKNAIFTEYPTPYFSIQQAYLNFARKAAEADLRNNTVFEAIAIRISSEWGRINWMTAGGYGAISLMMDNVKVGDKAVLTVKNLQSKGFYINVEAPKFGYDKIDRYFNEEEVLSGFCCTETDINKEVAEAAKVKPDDLTVKEDAMRSLARILYHCRASNSLERYRMVLTSLFIATCTGDTACASLSAAEAAYLGNILCFAQGGEVRTGNLHESMPREKADILKCLSLASNGTLCDIAPMLASEGICGKIASLLAARLISSNFSDEVKTDTDSIKEKICALLGVADSFVMSGKKATGKYGQTERNDLEFKSSYVFRNDNGQPDIDHQGRGQVFEAVCGFLNADGGTVFLGVNDTGDPILSEAGGIKGDIAWLTSNFSSIQARRFHQLGHNVQKPDTIEHYALFLNQEKKLYFKNSLLDKITIEPTEDADAIRITVKPSTYEIAYLFENESHTYGTAYARRGSSTLPMSEQQKKERLMNQRLVNKEIEFAIILQQACDQKRKVILRGYRSSSSGEIRDRLVVPVNLFYNDENVLCYDLDSHSEKQFRLARITSIDTDIPNPEYSHCFERKDADVFRWIGEKSYHIKVRMEVGAYNYLLEEYSTAKDLPAEELYMEESGKWILDTRLHGLSAMRRFYLGLADMIEILPTEDSPTLLKEIHEYLEQNLGSFKE